MAAEVSASGASARPLNDVLTGLPTTIFSVMTNLANEYKSVNLGQGFPDDEGPIAMKDIVAQAVTHSHNQYTMGPGLPDVREAVARHSKDFSGLPVDWRTQVLITAGATEALAAAFLGLVNSGDEVILLDPMYDSYAPIAKRAGAKIVTVALDVHDWSIPHEALRNAFSDRTKLILINTPHNPTGKVFSRSDLEFVASLLEQHNALAILDEVYEHLVFEGAEHVTLRSLPGMQERAVRIGSAGKTFSFTGWKIGWVTGPTRLVDAIGKAHQFLTFCLNSALQKAVGHGLNNERHFFKLEKSQGNWDGALIAFRWARELGATLCKKRQVLEQRLNSIGFRVLPAQGTYFLVADFRSLSPEGRPETDEEFAKRLTVEAGVTVIPVSAFYHGEEKPRHLVRFCFCKSDEKLQKACDQMECYFSTQKS